LSAAGWSHSPVQLRRHSLRVYSLVTRLSRNPRTPVTATNFAAPHKGSDAMAQANEGSKPFRPAKAKRKQDSDDDKRSRPARGHVADYPINGMMAIH